MHVTVGDLNSLGVVAHIHCDEAGNLDTLIVDWSSNVASAQTKADYRLILNLDVTCKL